ncbi:enoyl-CoA hydratase [Rhodoferax sp. WC2427]|uniref:enoyl-CoA hydratase n=1 Tax=Rhodoferax sp. WC2427 TaxID=3234144 RepID=UPI003466CD9F
MTDILTHTEDGILTITLNRVAKKNSLTAAMYTAISDALEAAQADPVVRVAVVQGHETIFSAGNDIGDFLKAPPSADSPVIRFLRVISSFPKPLIGAVCGAAVGVGTTLLLHCDLVYAGDNAAFSLPFVNLGLCPEAGSSYLLPRLMGHQRAAEALLLGDPFTAETALEVGLINRIVPPAEVHALAHRQAQRLAAKPMASLVASKRLMKQEQAAPVAARIDEEIAIFGRMLREPAAKEALTAFMENRRPDFSAF